MLFGYFLCIVDIDCKKPLQYDPLKPVIHDDSDMDSQIYKSLEDFENDAISGSASDIEIDQDIAKEILNSPKDFIPKRLQADLDTRSALGNIRNRNDLKEIQKTFDEVCGKINDFLGLNGEVKSITDMDPYVKLQDFLNDNLDQFLKNGHLSIEMHIRYFMCTYVIVFLPAEFIIVLPKIFLNFIEERMVKFAFLKDIFSSLHLFLDFVKVTSKSRFLITFTFGRANTLKEDLDFIISIPYLVLRDLPTLVSNLTKFEIKATGFEEFKKTYRS